MAVGCGPMTVLTITVATKLFLSIKGVTKIEKQNN